MTRIGPNHRLSVAKAHKKQTRAVYEGVLGGRRKSPARDIDVFEFESGANIGIFYVEDSEALTPKQHLSAIWLEFEVPNERAAIAGMKKLGIKPFKYEEKSHKYFQAPGGQCFRIAKR